jgi:hypothetical protein
MKRIFIETNEFRSRWEEIGMTEEDLRELQNYLLEHPEAGPVIQGTGGVRKLRWAREGRGKSGGVRTIYMDFRARETIWLITAFAKNEQSNISQDEKKAIKAYVKGLVGGQGNE